MYYEYIVNSKKNNNSKDISFCELESFIEQNKSYILETVYEYLNEFDELKHDKKCYFKFMNFLNELKKKKYKQEFLFDFIDISNEVITWDISCDMIHLKMCNLNKQESKEKTIQQIFKLE